MTDEELLLQAAKVAGRGYSVGRNWHDKGALYVDGRLWNPLADDGDALRLAVKLGIQVTPFLSGACAVATPDGWTRTESGYENGAVATRRAIVRAAAEIGRATKEAS